MLRLLFTISSLAVAWIFWSWHFEPIVVGCGVASVLFVTWLVRHLGTMDAEGAPFEINLRLYAYIPWLVWQVITSNLAVAKIILSPTMRIRPHLIRVPARQRTVLGRVIFANTITITPGTVSLDVRNDEILVHALSDAFADEEDAGKTAALMGWLETRVDASGNASGDLFPRAADEEEEE